MSALAADRITPRRKIDHTATYKVKASTKIWQGGMVATDANGYLVPASDTAALVVVGVAETSVDNSAGSSGDLSCWVSKGIFQFPMNGTDIAQAQIGTNATVYDDQTVSKASVTTNDIVVGQIEEIDGSTVWVRVGY